MKRFPVSAIAAAVVLHAGILLFGGLLLFRGDRDGAAVREVDLMSDDASKPAEEKPKPEPEQKADEKSADAVEQVAEAAPDLQSLAKLEAPVDAPALAPMSLDELSAALDGAGSGGESFGSSSSLKSGGRIGGAGVAAASEEIENEAAFSLGELDQRPRAIFQTAPNYPQELRRRGIEGIVQVVFLVDTTGRVQNPKVESSTDASLEAPAIDAVRQWKFEAGTRQGKRVPFKMRVPIAFRVT